MQKSPRAKFTETQPGYVRMEYTDLFGERVTVDYFAPRDGGYVRMWTKDGRHPQVCHGLSDRGPTLTCKPGELLATIRREYRAMRRANARG